MSFVPFNIRGLVDVARARCGGNVAEIIRKTACEAGPVAVRMVMTETRQKTDEVNMPVCWAIITRIYTQDADGWELLDETESVWTDAAVLEFAWEDAKENAIEMMRSAYTWFKFDDEKEVAA